MTDRSLRIDLSATKTSFQIVRIKSRILQTGTHGGQNPSRLKCVRWWWVLNVTNCGVGSFNYCLDSGVAAWHRLFVWRLSRGPGTPVWSRFTFKNSEFHEKIIRSYCVPHKPAPLQTFSRSPFVFRVFIFLSSGHKRWQQKHRTTCLSHILASPQKVCTC